MEEELQQLEELKNTLILYFVENGVRVVIAVLIFVFGLWLAKRLSKLILKLCDKRKLDPTLARFFAGFARLLVIVFALIMALSKANIEVTPFIALVGAGAFGLSLAVQGPISNYGAGIDYNADPQKAIDCLVQAIKQVDGIAKNREPDVGIDAFGDSSINIGYRVWVPMKQYHRSRYAVNMAVWRALEAAKITIPFPQRDVHLISKTESPATPSD